MTSRSADLDAVGVRGLPVKAVLEIVDDDGKPAALQIAFVDDSSLVSTVWTDWSLRLEKRNDTKIPEYLWPPEAYSRRLLLDVQRSDAEIASLIETLDETGTLMSVKIEVNGHFVLAQSIGGEISLSMR